MTSPSPRARPQARLAFVAALAAGLAACEQRLPTSAEIDAMDAVVADRITGVAENADQPTRFFVDGVAVDRERAREVPRDRIDRIEVIKAGTPTIHIFTKDAPGAARPDPGGEPSPEGEAARDDASGGEPLLIVDGRVREEAGLRSLDADEIESVEVIKGEAARRLYPDHPRAVNGVVLITTKR